MDKIIIEDGLSLVQNRGVGQYTQGIANMLQELGINYEMQRKNKLENIKNNIIRRILYLIWLNTFFLLKLLFTKNITKVIFTSTIVPIIKIKNIEYISVLHDILSTIHPECRTKIQNVHADFSTFCATHIADKIITVSEFSKNEIKKHFKVNDDKIFIVNSSWSTNLEFDSIKNTLILNNFNTKPKHYILSVATIHKHKNLQLLIDAFEMYNQKNSDIKLILVGANGNNKLLTNNQNIIFTGFISNEDLSFLYQNALIFVFPSLYEGFGTPCLDAQKYKIPLICSDIPVFKEVAGKGALFSKVTKEDFANTIEFAITNDMTPYIEEGQKNLNKYSMCSITKQLKKALY